jgi:hypothetical protein
MVVHNLRLICCCNHSDAAKGVFSSSLKNFQTIASDVWTHVWSIKCRRKNN